MNPAHSSLVKQTIKALSFVMGRRRCHVPKALSAQVVMGVLSTVSVIDADEMTAAAKMLREFVLGQRAADQPIPHGLGRHHYRDY